MRLRMRLVGQWRWRWRDEQCETGQGLMQQERGQRRREMIFENGKMMGRLGRGQR